MDLESFKRRKVQHIEWAMDARTQATGLSGLDEIRLVHEALPEINFDEVSLAVESKHFSTQSPFFVSGMTAGHDQASLINDRLASFCQDRGWIFGVGSQRRQLHESNSEFASFRKKFPSLFTVANLGLSQLILASADQVQRLLQDLQPNAIAIHLNPLQEVIQMEGTPNFRGGIDRIRRCVQELKIPVVVKETGCGISPRTANLLFNSGVHAIDVSGLGGTHWGRIDGMRAEENSLQRKCAQSFWDWGISTAESIQNVYRSVSRDTEIWASGGIRNGLDAAKCIALGANRVGFAKPALQSALEGEKELHQWAEQIEMDFKVALFCTGSCDVSQLRKKESSWTLLNNS